jgi:hypothetical protein
MADGIANFMMSVFCLYSRKTELWLSIYNITGTLLRLILIFNTVTTVDFLVEFLHVHLIDSCCVNTGIKVFAMFVY